MTLYKQLLTWSMGIFITISVVLFALEFHHMRSDLVEQQTVRFDDTLNAATFALSPYLQGEDLEEAQAIIKKIFDNHNYQSATLVSITSSEAVNLDFKEPKDSVPSWFMTLSNIKPVQKTVQISSNWQPLANLKVTSRPTFFYETLWNNTKSILFALTFCGVILVAGLSIVFRRILVPLQIIQVSAQNLANNKFDEVLETSKYQELNDVVSAFNQITKQLHAHFEQQSEEANKLRVRAYQDPVSGLANRKYMMTQLKSWIEGGSTGGIALLRVDQLDEVYEKEGYIQGDELTRNFAASLMEISSDEFNIARLNNSEFMLLAPNTSDEDMLELGRAMLNRVAALQNDPLDIAPLQAAVALIMKQTDESISDLLARADNGLVQARANREEPMILVPADSDESQPSFGKQQWKAIVDEAIANKEFIFSYQKAIDSNNQMIHQEVFAAIQKDDTRYSAGNFLNALESLDKGQDFDMHIIDAVFEQVDMYDPKYPIAVNLTQSSVNDTGFMRWLSQKMETNPEYANRVLFEIPEICFIKQPDNTKLLCKIITSHKYSFGIDNFGHNFGSIGYLNAYRPAYVKLDFAYTTQIDDNEKADVVFSISRTAANLSITTIASRVETIKQKNKLIELELGGFQGFVTEQINDVTEGQG
ncbi:bifunctional diguanylate cyclase/phosphodiesterase [Vibrio hibernica]|uniref:bifunctional diguanylate cyclase/phosphodiesterase n=1 Tax=Vibrio hibernica TaxID=2587465 RepID=UPI00187FCC2E|nr:EAL domain-containing protein [Vibrio hibernica]